MMGKLPQIDLYNTMTRQLERFVPIEPGKIRMYVCGPTVYDYIHIGNARPLIVFDVIARFFRSVGYEVKYVMNFTDVDDKLIRKAEQLNCTVQEVAETFIAAFEEDRQKLGVHSADVNPRVTTHMDQIIAFISSLVERGFAYESQGDVYFRTDRFAEYGKLSHQDLESLQHGARIDVNEKKEGATDFVLWKNAKPGEIKWESPWGEGRPGWHIECSAMAKEHLGETIDIHGGGHDLMFPHHECEIAQSEAMHDHPLAHYWLHNGYIQINQEKMSKSLGNGVLVRELMQNNSAATFRYFMLNTHYRSPLNFSSESLHQAVASVERIANCRLNLTHRLKLQNQSDNQETNSPATDQMHSALIEQTEAFEKQLCNDFNTPDAITAIFQLVSATNKYLEQNQVSAQMLQAIDAVFEKFNAVLGICPAPEENVSTADDPQIAEIEQLVVDRTDARKNKDWARADEIRNRLTELGVVVEDTAQGPRWVRK